MFDKIPIIATSYHRPREFHTSISSVFANTDVPYELTIMDNSCGAIDEELVWAESQGAKLIRNERNIGKGASFKLWYDLIVENNISEFFVSFDADLEVPPNWLSALIRAAHHAIKRSMEGFTSQDVVISKFGIMAPMYTSHSGHPSREYQLKHGCIYGNYPDRLKHVGRSVYYNTAVCGALYLVSKEFFVTVGGYRGNQIYADDDGPLCVAAWQNGYFAGFTTDVCVRHLDFVRDMGYFRWKHVTPEAMRRKGYWD